ncbi:MAG: hypothetical protein KJ926_07630, partial [Candidatus Omnitrophica bacterium]|nr:hypothetical protein [Candidatus Omnitrophota bacterium]
MKTSWRKCAMIIALIMLCGINIAVAQQYEVTILKTEGMVETRSDAGAAWMKVASGDKLGAGATVRTGANSSCILKW